MSTRNLIPWLAAVPIALGCAGSAPAGFITYSSSGSIQRQSTADPWGIGSVAAVTLSVTVSDAEPDQSGLVDRAWFNSLVSATFTVNGNAATPVLGAVLPQLAFYDNISGTDTVEISLKVNYNGQSEYVSASFALAPTSFTFAGTLEGPPVFPSTQTTFGRGTGNSSSAYRFDVLGGTAFTVSSETATPAPGPPGVLLGVVGVGCLGGFGWLRRRKLASAA